MDTRSRIARLERAEGAPAGTFSMTLATDGEASDGDILNIEGGVIPERMPLLMSHFNHPADQLGSITGASKHLDESPKRLRAVGEIEMTGDGPTAEIRRDVAHMIGAGHVGAVSIRWGEVEGSPPTPRVNLPSDHPHFVDDSTEKSWRKRTGLYFEKWAGLEGSVVALGADPQALIGRARAEVPEPVSRFWQGMAREAFIGAEGDGDWRVIEVYGREIFLPESLAQQIDAARATFLFGNQIAIEDDPSPDPVAPTNAPATVSDPAPVNLRDALSSVFAERDAALLASVREMLRHVTGR